jgi:potassium-transporting ATPase KdpC subunit
MLRRQLLTGLMMTIVLTVLLGVAYPLVSTAVAQGLFPHRANGSFVKDNGAVVGSSLIGQTFLRKDGSPDPRYFQPRPSAAGDGYDPRASGGTNLGPGSRKLLDAVAARVAAYRSFNQLAAGAAVPVDAVTSSGSGLDPDISLANARLQAARVASARSLPVSEVLALVERHVSAPAWGFVGEKTVNVVDLDLALDRLR